MATSVAMNVTIGNIMHVSGSARSAVSIDSAGACVRPGSITPASGMAAQVQSRCTTSTPTPDSVGMGSYAIDSHNVQRYITPAGHVQNEGDIQVSPGGAYPISYRALTPKAGDCRNLLVPVCLSSSHMAYGSIRMEPVFFVLGQSAGTAAVMAIDRNAGVQDVPYAELKAGLLKDGQVLTYARPARAAQGIDPSKIPGIVADDSKGEAKGDWGRSDQSVTRCGGTGR